MLHLPDDNVVLVDRLRAGEVAAAIALHQTNSLILYESMQKAFATLISDLSEDVEALAAEI